jgi:hypothetical protein
MRLLLTLPSSGKAFYPLRLPRAPAPFTISDGRARIAAHAKPETLI